MSLKQIYFDWLKHIFLGFEYNVYKSLMNMLNLTSLPFLALNSKVFSGQTQKAEDYNPRKSRPYVNNFSSYIKFF